MEFIGCWVTYVNENTLSVEFGKTDSVVRSYKIYGIK